MYFLPESLKTYVSKNWENIYEIRIRGNRPVYVNIFGEFKKLILKLSLFFNVCSFTR